MKILITGAGGFLGRHLAKLLVNNGHQTYNFSRKQHPNLPNVIQIRGDLRDYKAVEEAVKGMDVVFHMASKVDMWGRWKDFYEINVLGTENIIKACQKNLVTKLIYTSTPSVAFSNNDLINAEESTPYPKHYYSMYAKSKSLAEKKIIEANNASTLCTVSLRPHLIFGPNDPHLLPRLIRIHKQKKLFIVGDGKNLVDVTYVENAALAHMNAMKKLNPKSKICGKTYFIGQGPVNLWEFINHLLIKKGLPPIKRKIPFIFAYALGGIIEFFFTIFRIYKIEPPMTRFISMQLAKSHFFNHNNAQNDLDFHPSITIEEAIKNC